MPTMRAIAIWGGAAAAMLISSAIALQSPLLQWRSPVYIIGGFAGVVGMALLLLQPLLANSTLPGHSRNLHRWGGAALVVAVILHIAALWVTSPPDVIDVLLFRSPTPFGIWGAVAMWGVIATAILAIRRRKLHPRTWQRAHLALAVVVVSSTLLHALLIEGTMGQLSKRTLAALIVAATAWTIWSRIRPARHLARR